MEVVLHLPVVPNVELVAAKAVEAVGGAIGMHQGGIEAASVAIVEACLNAMEHGGGQMVVRMSAETFEGRPGLVIEVEDQGKGFDPSAAPRNSATRVAGCTTKRGWGLTLIRELMDDVQIRSHPGRTLVRMRKFVESSP
ncbi:MAG: ATP-binding protein [Thermoanaerobaculales bacterium]|jgi:serine/threonine-protein kinase RsbW|nr:ATP-binding protein [Thermoanaerobaculales bacterium]